MAHLTCPDCGAEVDVRPFLALHRWPAAYAEDASAAVVPCEAGDAVSVRSVLIDDDVQTHESGPAGVSAEEEPAHGYVFAIVEDEPDMQVLIALMLRKDGRLDLLGQATSAEEALAMLDRPEVRATFERAPGVIVLDHGIEGAVMGLAAAPLLKQKVPTAKILLFTAFDMAKDAADEPAVDAFLRKDRLTELLPTVQALLGLDERRSTDR